MYDIVKCISLVREMFVLIPVLLKFIPAGQVGNISLMVQAMAWRRTGAKALPGPVVTLFYEATYGVTGQQCVKLVEEGETLIGRNDIYLELELASRDISNFPNVFHNSTALMIYSLQPSRAFIVLLKMKTYNVWNIVRVCKVYI